MSGQRAVQQNAVEPLARPRGQAVAGLDRAHLPASTILRCCTALSASVLKRSTDTTSAPSRASSAVT